MVDIEANQKGSRPRSSIRSKRGPSSYFTLNMAFLQVGKVSDSSLQPLHTRVALCLSSFSLMKPNMWLIKSVLSRKAVMEVVSGIELRPTFKPVVPRPFNRITTNVVYCYNQTSFEVTTNHKHNSNIDNMEVVQISKWDFGDTDIGHKFTSIKMRCFALCVCY